VEFFVIFIIIIKTQLCLICREKTIPPSINIEHLDTDIVGDLRIPQSAVLPDLSSNSPPLLEEPGAEHEGPILPKFLVLKNSFGFGGTNVSLVFAELPAD
jgi:hypothetical protein